MDDNELYNYLKTKIKDLRTRYSLKLVYDALDGNSNRDILFEELVDHIDRIENKKPDEDLKKYFEEYERQQN